MASFKDRVKNSVRDAVRSAQQGEVHIAHPVHAVVARNVGESGRETSASSHQDIHITQDGHTTRVESSEERSDG